MGRSSVWGVIPISMQSAIRVQKQVQGDPCVVQKTDVQCSRAQVDAWQDVETVVRNTPTAKPVDCNKQATVWHANAITAASS